MTERKNKVATLFILTLGAIPLMVKLDVPLFLQPHVDYCVPACIKMVLEYLRNVHGKKIPRLSIKTIAKNVGAEIGKGTVFHDVVRINERLLSAEPSVEFVPDYPCDWKEIVEENEKGKPIIAWVWLSDSRGRGCGHSVVVFDIDPSRGVIYYNDPARGVIEEEIGRFISSWEHEDVNRSLIKVKVGERVQRRIPEYLAEIGEEEE